MVREFALSGIALLEAKPEELYRRRTSALPNRPYRTEADLAYFTDFTREVVVDYSLKLRLPLEIDTDATENSLEVLVPKLQTKIQTRH